MDIYVSPEGNNNWSGLSPDKVAGKGEGPLRHVECAIEKVRQLRNQNVFQGMATIHLRGGLYRLNTPIRLSSRDSDLTIQSHAGEAVYLSGGTEIKDWEKSVANGHQCWVADISREMEFIPEPRSLFVNDESRPRSRFPEEGWLTIMDVPDVHPEKVGLFDGSRRFVVESSDFNKAWRNLSDIEAIVNHIWVEERMPVESFDAATNTVTSSRTSIFALRNLPWMDSTPCARFAWENIFEALHNPGEWYVDRTEKRLYYIPRPGERWDNTTVVLPHLQQLVRLHGSNGGSGKLRNIHFSGIQFKHTDWSHPLEAEKWWDLEDDADSWPGRQSFNHFKHLCQATMRENPWPGKVQFAAMPQGAFDLPGVVSLAYAERCSISGCTFSCLGFYAIDVKSGCRELGFSRNTIFDIGGGGIKADGAADPTDADNMTSHLAIRNNHIHDCGNVFAAALGIGILNSGKNCVENNEISHLNYTGISIGWSWNFDETVSGENFISHNHIHHIGQGRLSDMGGIYTLGRQPGTLIKGNLIHDVYGTHYGGWGIYLDEGSSFIRLEGNIIYRTGNQCIHEHWGRQNVIMHNLLALPKANGIVFSKEEAEPLISYPPKGMVFLCNIVLTRGHAAFKGAPAYLRSGVLASDLNLFWDLAAGRDTRVWMSVEDNATKSPDELLGLPDLRAAGIERHSRVDDPRFNDPESGDFSLPVDSPVHQLGIQLLNPEDAGIQSPRPEA